MLNAFALPGGFIAVHSALLIAAQNESELASVLSHEIGHVTQRHIARMIGQQKQDALMPLAAMILAALASKAGPDAAIGVFMGGQGLAIQRQLNFSRDAEREADRVGFQIMGAAGFDTSGMVAFFQRMQAATKVYSDLTPPWLMSHPLTSERISDIRARIRETPYRQRIDGLEFHLVRARARVLQDESTQGRADAQAAFEAQLKQQNRQQQAAAQYGLALLALKRSELAKAADWLAKARATMKPVTGAVFSTGQSASDGAAMFASMSLEIKLAPGQPAAGGADAEGSRAGAPAVPAVARHRAPVRAGDDRRRQAGPGRAVPARAGAPVPRGAEAVRPAGQDLRGAGQADLAAHRAGRVVRAERRGAGRGRPAGHRAQGARRLVLRPGADRRARTRTADPRARRKEGKERER